MNSGFSNFEKSVEECINYNFDDNSPINQKSKRPLSRSKSKDHQVNGKSKVPLTNWLECKNSYSWLYVSNENPKCSICNEAIKECNEMSMTSWTNSEMSLEKHDSKFDEEKILQIHMTSDNHIKATEILSTKLTETKSDCEFTEDIPSFISNSEWNYLKTQFSWLIFINDSLSCSICDENSSKQKKSISNCNVFGNLSQKNQRDFNQFEKHGKKPGHSKNESPSENSNLIPKKEESKRVLNPIQRRSIVFSQPNVTTRTAIRKSLYDRNIVPESIAEDSWNDLKSEYPWVYAHQNILGCSYCEDAFKTNNESMMSTSWTNPELTENRRFTSLKELKMKYRLNQHQLTRNHVTATKILSIAKQMNATHQRKQESTLKTETVPVPVVESKPTDFRVPSTVRASRKSAPSKLTFDDKLEHSQTEKSTKPPAKIDLTSIPSFLTQEQYVTLTAKYGWLKWSNDNLYNCSVCHEALKIDPEAVIKTKFTSGPDPSDPTPTYTGFRKRLYRHAESKSHLNARNIINGGCSEFPNESSIAKTSAVASPQQPLPTVPSADSRFTRLKSGIRSKIDYKRMSEGNSQSEPKEHYLYEVINLPVPESPKKRKETSNICSSATWMCPQCKSHFRNTDDLIQHISLCDYHQSFDSIQQQQLACPCNPLMFRFNTITKLDLHAAQEHDNQSYFHCYICSDRYNRLTALYHHMLTTHLISTWDPFEAYLPAKPSEQFLCVFCSSNFNSNLLLTKHYIFSDCRIRLQPTIVLEPIPGIELAEEVTVLDVEELPDEKSAVIYSPVKKSKSQHNRISRNHPLRRFCSNNKNKIKESPRKPDIQEQTISESLNKSNSEKIDNLPIDQSDKSITNKSTTDKSITNKSIIDIGSINQQNSDNVIIDQIEPNPDQSPTKAKPITSITNRIMAKTRNSKSKTKKPAIKSPKTQSNKSMEITHQVVDLNEIMHESRSLVTESSKRIEQSPLMNSKRKKEPIRIQSQLSPCKKLKPPPALDCPPVAQLPMGMPTALNDTDNSELILSGLSFMDRMKKIRQLKKNRTEQQREQMMAVDRKIAEINEQCQGPLSLTDKSDRIKKLLSSDQYSMADLKSIIQSEKAPRSSRAPEKRRNPEEINNLLLAPPGTPPKQPKPATMMIDNSSKSSISPLKSESFSCNVCQLKFKSLRARDSHTTSEHKGLKLFCCKVCDLSFTTHILLRKHAQKYHIDNVSLAVFGKENASEINFSFACPFCPQQFTSRSGLNHHITSGHRTDADSIAQAGGYHNDFIAKLIAADPNFSPQSCLICQEIMNNEFELDIHTIEHQKECQTTELEPTQFACPKCCRLFFGRDGKSYLKDHYNIIHLSKPLPNCEECDTKFSSTVCYSMHRKFVKNCSKKTSDQLKIDDPYEKLNDPMKLAFVCSRCQTLVAGQSAEKRFEEHKIDCNSTTDRIDECPFVIHPQPAECVDNGQ